MVPRSFDGAEVDELHYGLLCLHGYRSLMVDAARPLASMPATRLQAVSQLRFCAQRSTESRDVSCLAHGRKHISGDLQPRGSSSPVGISERRNSGPCSRGAEMRGLHRSPVAEMLQKEDPQLSLKCFLFTASFARAAMVGPSKSTSPVLRATGTAGVARGTACAPGQA